MIVDLHTHTLASDGALTPSALVARAAAAGVQLLAITDHDTVAGLAQLEDGEATRVLVLGDPAYYARYGFTPERAIQPAHPIPAQWAEAWRSITLKPAEVSGRLIAPAPWDDPALWA